MYDVSNEERLFTDKYMRFEKYPRSITVPLSNRCNTTSSIYIYGLYLIRSNTFISGCFWLMLVVFVKFVRMRNANRLCDSITGASTCHAARRTGNLARVLIFSEVGSEVYLVFSSLQS